MDSKKRNSSGLTEQEFLNSYSPGHYERPSVTADILIFSMCKNKETTKAKLRVLLIKRIDHPYMDCWALPGGFVAIDESIEDAAYRELKEETNVENVYLEQLYTFGEVSRDPRMRVISTAYLALTSEENIHPIAGDDAKEAKWFVVRNGESCLQFISEDKQDILLFDKESQNFVMNDRINGKLAFDHLNIVLTGLERLKNKVEYTDVAFSLLPHCFTIPEAKEIYQILLSRPLDSSNFRRDIIKKLIPTNMRGDDKKKSMLYSYNPCWKSK